MFLFCFSIRSLGPTLHFIIKNMLQNKKYGSMDLLLELLLDLLLELLLVLLLLLLLYVIIT